MGHNLSSKELKLKRNCIGSHNRQVQGRDGFHMVGFQSSYLSRGICVSVSLFLLNFLALIIWTGC